MSIEIRMPQYKRPVGKLNFGGADFVNLQNADMSLVKGVIGVRVLDLSYSFGFRGNWDFSCISKVFLYGADVSKIKNLRAGEEISFYGAKGLNGIIDLRKTKQAYFQDSDLCRVKTILCDSQTQLNGLDSCCNWNGNIERSSYSVPEPKEEDLQTLIAQRIKENNLQY